MKHFPSSKSHFVIIILWSLVAFFVSMIIKSIYSHNFETTPLVIISLACALIIWILLDTRYVIKSDKLFYRSGPFRGLIDIKKVTKMEYCKDLSVNTLYKPALDFKGFILTYTAEKTIYVSPKNSENFANELLRINPTIEYSPLQNNF